jgi:tRNA dimethylallyltransferase
MQKLLIVCGPTSSGKTALALELAKKWNGELVSADSRQVYRGMDIGTGKDVIGKSKVKSQKLKLQIKNQKYELIPYDMDGIPLWLVDVVDPDEEFSVAHYQHIAHKVIEDIQKRGKLPIVVGGTGQYVQSLLSPIETSHIPPNKKLRKQLEKLSLEDLQNQLVDRYHRMWETMNQSDRQNPRRLIRKIEIAKYLSCHPGYHLSIPGIKEVPIPGIKTQKYDILLLGLSAPYPVLYKGIDARVDKRVKQGVREEITSLLKKGYTWEMPSMNTFGYKEWKEYFTHNSPACSDAPARIDTRSVSGRAASGRQLLPAGRHGVTHNLQPIIQRWKWDEHGYARRQMTWFKKMKGIHWADITEKGWQKKVETVVNEWYTNKERCTRGESEKISKVASRA